ncbi:MAG TPA: DUF971 domain-containing protein [Gemmatimonadales bacterium]|nr:DUF971 domain-containing protein [Gemmatimonadales bacterium]
MSRPPLPVALERRDDGILVTWDHAGHEALFASRALRLACPCAACVDEMTGRPLLEAAAVAADVRPLQLSLVGAYALRVAWSDGHATGLYTFELLRRTCPCPRCATGRGDGVAEPPAAQ